MTERERLDRIIYKLATDHVQYDDDVLFRQQALVSS